ncbi:GAF domain-containing protein [Roseateles amylovorans]|uniref:GAF domain-containing protein n=1 Tax=Roseateles amylovorans TaxID=2978473 RepID=A0ABY6B162_9BURK|nr:GAF domain-containing protein [Roseateles amylovorans]UXH78429.1 GAF domain-containing protein [Roseateles amylovorans]
MLRPPLPANEAERLQTLREMLILDTPPEARFDRIVQFAAEEFGVPIALLSLIDENRQWFKARFGLAVCETSRDVSFCGHAIHAPQVMVVPDATEDPRFADNPMVVGPPHIRFYAGAPLEPRPGVRIGTLCLIDRRRRTLDDTDLAILMSLRDLALAEFLGQSTEAG